jgi:CRP-like cAMP-binding protein
MLPSSFSLCGNRLLASLAADDLAALQPHFVEVALEARQSLEMPDEPIEQVYFPGRGILSVIARNGGGEQTEVGVIGPEGMTAVPVLLGADRSPNATLVQISCAALRVPAPALRAAVLERPTLHRSLLLYAQASFVQIAHTVLANNRYALEERLARWLLMCHDRTGHAELPLTHEFLALMLGVRRAGVTTALHLLEGGGAIRASRGLVTVRDRTKLEEIADDAYGIPEREYRRLIGSVLA